MADAAALAALRAFMLAHGKTQSDLAHLLNSRSRASEILNGRRAPSLKHRRLLLTEWQVPSDILWRL